MDQPQPGSASRAGRTQPATEPDNRFPREARLLRRADFESVYQQGRRHFSPSMTVFYLRRGQAEGAPRVGLTVGRALGKAVERNRIRRRMREAVRHSLQALSGPWDVVINPKRSALDTDFAALREEMRRAFETVQRPGSGAPARPRTR